MPLVIAAMRIRPDRMPEVQEALKKFMPKVNSEEGTMEYIVFRGMKDPNVLVFHERYRDGEALQAHMSSDEIKEFRGVMMSLVEGEVMGGLVEEMASADR